MSAKPKKNKSVAPDSGDDTVDCRKAFHVCVSPPPSEQSGGGVSRSNIGVPSFLRLLEIREPRPICTWAEEEVKIDQKTPFRIRFAPYLREMLETPLREDVALTAYMLFSRGGKTTAANVVMG